MPGRTIAIGDVHGCSKALSALLDAIDAQPDDTIVTLGDYIDRGLDSRGVLNLLIALDERCRLIPLMGNHDRMLLDIFAPARRGRSGLSREIWLGCGGVATLQSYGDLDHPNDIPEEHIAFLHSCRLYHESDTHLFMHANYQPDRPLSEQSVGMLLWESLRSDIPEPHISGKTAIVGHTSQKSGEVLDLGYLLCIDTYCYGGGWLTALDVDTKQVWQANERGELRR